MTHSWQMLIRLARRAAIVAAALVPGALAPSVALGDRAAYVETAPALEVTDTSATLTARIRPDEDPTSFRFQYDSALYARVTPEATLPADEEVHAVSAAVTGLQPDTVHRFRVLAWQTDDPDHVAVGRFQTFRTAKAAVVTQVTPAPALVPPAPAVALGGPPAPPPPPRPELGRSVVVEPVRGTVSVQVPGASSFTPLAADATVPVGTVVNARQGTVRLIASLPGGATHAGDFHGGLFEVRQHPSARGATELRLRGGNFSTGAARGARAGAAAAQRRRKPPVRRLWSQDSGGRFLTRGRNSVATVRGTRWVTTDTCAGTRTTVTSGSVAVRDLRRKRTVLVRAGHSYLARSRR
jgi:hypothetical protein